MLKCGARAPTGLSHEAVGLGSITMKFSSTVTSSRRKCRKVGAA